MPEVHLIHLKEHLRKTLPDLKSWQDGIEGSALFFWSGKEWDVGTEKDDGVGIAFDFSYAKQPMRTNGDPWAGIYVPESWPQRKKFRDRLRQVVPHPVLEDWEGPPEDMWPIWTYVRLVEYAKEDTFDMDGLLVAFEQRARDMMELRPYIDKAIKEVT